MPSSAKILAGLILLSASTSFAHQYDCTAGVGWFLDAERQTYKMNPLGNFDFDSSRQEQALFKVDAAHYVSCHAMDESGKTSISCAVTRGRLDADDVTLIGGSMTSDGSPLTAWASVADDALPTKTKDIMVSCKLK